MNSGIYMIRHRDSGKTYIGRSTNVASRWSQHKSCASTNKRDNNPIYNALRKYGHDAFEWKLLTTAPDRLLPLLEAQFIVDWGTLSPNGYNVGGTEGGFPSRAIIEAMEPHERERWRAVMTRVSVAGAQALRAKRSDAAFEEQYLATKKAASFKREANIRKRRADDPEYDARLRAGRSAAAKKNPNRNEVKAAASFRERMNSNPDFAATVRENRAKAGGKRWAELRARKEAILQELRDAFVS